MKKSFYHYFMKFRGALKRNTYSELAEEMYRDPAFPKQSEDYHEISSYIEMKQYSLDAVSIFDQAWDDYENNR